MAELNEKQLKMCEESTTDYTDLKAIFLNCTLKKSPELSHTQGLIDISKAIMEKNGIGVEVLR
ncbi:MAG: flavodoxin family protein, partial [Thermodesulfobacteriota bacterium]